MAVNSISYPAWSRVAAAHVENCGRGAAGSRAAQTARLSGELAGAIHMLMWVRGSYANARENEVKALEGVLMKSMVFILVGQPHSRGMQTVGPDPRLGPGGWST